VVQTSLSSFFGKTDPEDLARYPGTLVIYMGLREFPGLIATLQKYLPADLPVAVVYYAGDPTREKVVKGTLADIQARIASEKERWGGLVVVGRCLTGPAFSLGE